MKRRILGFAMSLVLVFALFPVEVVRAASEGLAIVYVSKDVGSDTNTGASLESAVCTLNKAVELVADGGIIYVSGGAYTDDTENNDSPLIIAKKVTIQGIDESNIPSISSRAGGIVLGADVTLKNVQYGVASFLTPGIAANGHTLNLINVQQDSSLRPLQIYGGTFYDINGENNYGKACAGDASVINIVGGSYQAVYAGSVNGSFDKSVTVNVSKGDYSLSLGGVYASGTQKVSTGIPTLKGTYTVGAVSVNLSNANVATVSGVKADNSVSLTVSSQYPYSCAIDNIDNITVAGGVFAPTGTWNNDTNVTLSGGSESKATLDLSGFTQALGVQNFIDSSAPNILVLPAYTGTEASLVISGTHTGITELRTPGGMPWESSDNPGNSGMMKYEHAYVTTADGTGSFVITNPYSTQGGYSAGVYSGIEIEKTQDTSNKWITTAAPEFVVELVSFAFTNDEVTAKYEDINIMGDNPVSVELPLTLAFPSDYVEEDCYISWIPLNFKVTYNDNEYIYIYPHWIAIFAKLRI